MTVPAAGTVARKPAWRFLPEIHASRLSVSGSLRPKLGLLILFVLVVLSIVLVVVPLVTNHRTDTQELRSAVDPNLVLLGEYLRSVWRSSPNSVVSPVGLAALLNLIHHVGDQDIQTHTKPYLSPIQYKVDASYKFFNTNLSLKVNSDKPLPVAFLESDSLVGVDVKRIPSFPSNHLSILNNNSIRLGPYTVSEGDFYETARKVVKVEMALVRGRGRSMDVEQGRLVEVQAEDGFRIQVLIPHRANSLGAVVDNLENILAAQKPSLQQNTVILKLPLLNLGEVYGGRKVLKDLGLSEIFSPERVHLDSVQLNLDNITHVTSIHMTKGNASAENDIKDIIICDRSFLFNIYIPAIPIPLITGLYTHPSSSAE